MSLAPIVETAVLKETEEALAEFVTVSLNVGLSKSQMAMMLRSKADEIAPPLIIPHSATLQ
jgi:hypothetical protein